MYFSSILSTWMSGYFLNIFQKYFQKYCSLDIETRRSHVGMFCGINIIRVFFKVCVCKTGFVCRHKRGRTRFRRGGIGGGRTEWRPLWLRSSPRRWRWLRARPLWHLSCERIVLCWVVVKKVSMVVCQSRPEVLEDFAGSRYACVEVSEATAISL